METSEYRRLLLEKANIYVSDQGFRRCINALLKALSEEELVALFTSDPPRFIKNARDFTAVN